MSYYSNSNIYVYNNKVEILLSSFAMNNSIKHIIIKILKDTIHKIENNECALDDDEMLDIAKNLVYIKLNIEQTCHYINISRATLNRMMIDGYDGLVFNRWCADMCKQGIPIDWDKFI